MEEEYYKRVLAIANHPVMGADSWKYIYVQDDWLDTFEKAVRACEKKRPSQKFKVIFSITGTLTLKWLTGPRRKDMTTLTTP